jgi:hypothetical protein
MITNIIIILPYKLKQNYMKIFLINEHINET